MVVATSGAFLSTVDKVGGDTHTNNIVDVGRANYRRDYRMVEFEIIMGNNYDIYMGRRGLDGDFHVCRI